MVDAGDQFFSGPALSPPELQIGKLKAWALLEACNRLETAAINIGDRDLAAGLPFLKALADSARYPFLSANLVDPAGQLIFKPSVVVEKNGLRVALVGASSALSNGVDYYFQPPLPAVKREVERLAAETDIIAVLFHGNDADREALITAGLPIDILFHSHVQRPGSIYSKGRTAVINLGKEGRDLNIVDLRIQSPGEPLVDLSVARKQLKFVERTIKRLRRNQPESQTLEEIYAAKPNVLKTIATIRERQAAAQATIDNARNTVDYERLILGKTYADDRAMLQLVEETLRAIDRAELLISAIPAFH